MTTTTDQRLFRKGFGLRAEVRPLLADAYHSALVDRMVEGGHVLQAGDVTFHLAKEFGFCYGVDRAVEYAYETRRKFPDRRVFLTGEIIHNPFVNEKLKEMGIGFLSGRYADGVTMEDLDPEDVVLLPAFGVTTEEMDVLSRRGCILVDTTCGSVLNVWKRVERYAREGYTSVVHGKWYHEETRATCSRATSLGGQTIVVRDMAEAQIVIGYMLHGISDDASTLPYLGQSPAIRPAAVTDAESTLPRLGESSAIQPAGVAAGSNRAAFLEHFRDAVSEGFDPDLHLLKVGVANQTTMLMSESLAIAEAIGAAIARRDGPRANERFLSFDTICSATQERQDAILELIQQPLDLLIVIGGYNSSNTANLAAIAARKLPTYHVDDPACLVSADEIRHRPSGGQDLVAEGGWLPSGPLRIGLTAGASTPNNKIGETIERILQLRGIPLPSVDP
jgi:4-hydroxy-3-methylbut-2-enyl diphosphate reductase